MTAALADTSLYFAYGSNMLLRRLRSPERAPAAAYESLAAVTTTCVARHAAYRIH